MLDDDLGIKIVNIILILLIISLIIAMYDGLYIIPIADEKANKYCQNLNFDFYESYSRVGILSKTPIAIKCKYVEQYRQIDINKPLIEIEK